MSSTITLKFLTWVIFAQILIKFHSIFRNNKRMQKSSNISDHRTPQTFFSSMNDMSTCSGVSLESLTLWLQKNNFTSEMKWKNVGHKHFFCNTFTFNLFIIQHIRWQIICFRYVFLMIYELHETFCLCIDSRFYNTAKIKALCTLLLHF